MAIESVLAEIARERRQQIARGYTADHDDAHVKGELPRAAAFYALESEWPLNEPLRLEDIEIWPWPENEPSFPENRRHALIVAAAFIVAEIERLDRRSLSEPKPEAP